ncbi:MAG: hypothetical protein WA857_12605 [Candidatus Acidiferrum sp.]
MTEDNPIIPVWFFVGIMFLLYGLLILGSGIAEWPHPPNTVLSNLHAPVWWGALMTLLGAMYCIRYRPGRKKAS